LPRLAPSLPAHRDIAAAGPHTPMPGTVQMKRASNRLIRDRPALLTHGTLSQHESRAQARADARGRPPDDGLTPRPTRRICQNDPYGRSFGCLNRTVRQCITAALCAPCFGLSATVRDGSRSPATTGRNRRGEHPGARVRMAETLIGGACQQHVLRCDVRHSRRRTCNTPSAATPGCWPRCCTDPCLHQRA
jgi:hypothetical protein